MMHARHANAVVHTIPYPEGRLTRGVRGWSFITTDGHASHRFWPTADQAHAALVRQEVAP